MGCRGGGGRDGPRSRGKPKEGSVGNGGTLNETLLVAEDGRLVRRTATGLRSPHAETPGQRQGPEVVSSMQSVPVVLWDGAEHGCS